MIETAQLYAGAIRAVGAHRLQQILGFRRVQSVYKLAADRMVLDTPVRDDVQRITSVVIEIAAHPDKRPELIMFELYFKELFDRVIRRKSPSPLTATDCMLRAQEMCGEFGDVLRELKPGFVPDRVAHEAAELIAVLEQLVACAEAADDVTVRAIR